MAEFVFYIDETGNRKPDKKSDESRKGRDWFGFGGFLIDSKDVDAAKTAHSAFCKEWGIKHPFHITDMLGCYKNFRWLARKDQRYLDQFWNEYAQLICSLNAIGHGCIVDRPGYLARGYLEKNPEDYWMLCRSAFDISMERATKYAMMNNRKLRVVFESDPPFNSTVKGYFKNLKTKGLEFDGANSAKYQPLDADSFAKTLTTIEYKDKSSRMLQFADTFIYSIARHKYDKHFSLGNHLRDRKCIMNFALGGQASLIKEMGIKYYCFD